MLAARGRSAFDVCVLKQQPAIFLHVDLNAQAIEVLNQAHFKQASKQTRVQHGASFLKEAQNVSDHLWLKLAHENFRLVSDFFRANSG